VPLLICSSAFAMKIYIDGSFYPEAEAKVSVFDHGLLYGDGIFEGIRFYNGRVFKLTEHLERLWDSAKAICLTGTVDGGLRTLSGGQYSLQVEGYLAVEQGATPPLVVEATHSVRDVFAVLGSVADAEVGVQVEVDGSAYCTLTVPAGQTTSAATAGLTLGALEAGSKVTLNVLQVGQTYPGADLTVVIRL